MFAATLRAAVVMLGLLWLGGCGGGGSSGPAAPTSFSYPTAPALVVGHAIAPLAPSVSGTVSSYAVSPSLPSGLSIDTTSGMITGTPTAVTPQAAYTVSATGPGGTTSTQVSLTVNDIAPSIGTAATRVSFTKGVKGRIAGPTASGGAIVSWTVTPALPDGLAVSNSDGSISGVPTGTSMFKDYTLTATNSGGQSTTGFALSVASAPLLDLGHTTSMSSAKTSGNQVLSQDQSGHWILWNATTQAQIASGKECTAAASSTINAASILCNPVLPVDLEGSTVVIGTPAGFDIRAAADGHLLGSVAAPNQSWALSADGSYIAVISQTALQTFSTAGQLLATRSGDYSSAVVFAAPAQVLVAQGPAGAHSIETVLASSGSSSTSASFSGSFLHWFVDGGRFLTSDATANRIYVYSSSAVQQDSIVPNGSLANNVAGQGNYFWTFDSGSHQLVAYRVGASSAPAATLPFSSSVSTLVSSGLYVGALASGYVSVVDLSGNTPTQTQHQNLTYLSSPSAFAAFSATHWVAGGYPGVLIDSTLLPGTPKFYGYGNASSIAAGSTFFAVHTASGQLVYFDSVSGEQLGSLFRPSYQRIAMSTDGSVLAVGVNDATTYLASAVNVYGLPSGSLGATLPFGTASAATLSAFSMAGSGTVIAAYVPSSAQSLQVFASSGAMLWSAPATTSVTDALPIPPYLSRDGTYAVVTNYPEGLGTGSSSAVYKSGTLQATRDGTAAGWIDDTRLLVDNYDVNKIVSYLGSSIYDPTGALLGSPALPESKTIQTVDAAEAAPDLLYIEQVNSIFSISSASILWTSGSPSSGTGAIAGQNAVFQSDNLVLLEPR